MADRRVLPVIMVIIATVGITGVMFFYGNVDLSQVPPPNEPPTSERNVVTYGDVVLWAEAEYWQDFMFGDDPDNPFYTLIRVNITNNGDTTIENLDASRVTIYYNGTVTPFVTLNLTQYMWTFVPIVVPPGESVIIEYTNDRSTVFSPTVEEGTSLYSRILFRWGNDQEAILTTSPTELYFTF